MYIYLLCTVWSYLINYNINLVWYTQYNILFWFYWRDSLVCHGSSVSEQIPYNPLGGFQDGLWMGKFFLVIIYGKKCHCMGVGLYPLKLRSMKILDSYWMTLRKGNWCTTGLLVAEFAAWRYSPFPPVWRVWVYFRSWSCEQRTCPPSSRDYAVWLLASSSFFNQWSSIGWCIAMLLLYIMIDKQRHLQPLQWLLLEQRKT